MPNTTNDLIKNPIWVNDDLKLLYDVIEEGIASKGVMIGDLKLWLETAYMYGYRDGIKDFKDLSESQSDSVMGVK